MKAVIIPFVLFGLVTLLIFGMGAFKSHESSIAGEGIFSIGSWEWSLEPGKISYKHWGNQKVTVKLSNLSSQPMQFDMGDGSTVNIEPYNSEFHTYRLKLKGQTERFLITELSSDGSGLNEVHAYHLKIEPKPRTEGGDER